MRASDDFGAAGAAKKTTPSGDAGDGASGDDLASADASMDDGPIVDVEITDPDNPRPAAPPGPTAREKILGWLGGAAKATADATLDISKATIETSRKVASSDDTKRVLATVAATPKNVGSWWERDARSWMNNVAARATGGTVQKDKRGFPTAQMWTDPPASDEKKNGAEKKPGDEKGAEGGSKAPGGVDGTTAPLPQEKKKPEM
jgi:hypothetical protein